MKAIKVTFKSGATSVFKYQTAKAMKEDFEIIDNVFRDKDCYGYIGNGRDGFFINARDISAVEVLSNKEVVAMALKE